MTAAYKKQDTQQHKQDKLCAFWSCLATMAPEILSRQASPVDGLLSSLKSANLVFFWFSSCQNCCWCESNLPDFAGGWIFFPKAPVQPFGFQPWSKLSTWLYFLMYLQILRWATCIDIGFSACGSCHDLPGQTWPFTGCAISIGFAGHGTFLFMNSGGQSVKTAVAPEPKASWQSGYVIVKQNLLSSESVIPFIACVWTVFASCALFQTLCLFVWDIDYRADAGCGVASRLRCWCASASPADPQQARLESIGFIYFEQCWKHDARPTRCQSLPSDCEENFTPCQRSRSPEAPDAVRDSVF